MKINELKKKEIDYRKTDLKSKPFNLNRSEIDMEFGPGTCWECGSSAIGIITLENWYKNESKSKNILPQTAAKNEITKWVLRQRCLAPIE